MTIKIYKESPPPPPPSRRLEEDANEYMNLYGTATDGVSYPFGQSGSDSADCEMDFFNNYSGEIQWTYNCWSFNVPEFVQQTGNDDDETTKYVHPLYCWGQGADFDNFTCRLYVQASSSSSAQDPWFEMDIHCSAKNDDDGCTCSAASIQGVSCDVCETCTKFSTSEIASWTTTPWMVPNVHLSCPADGIYGVSQTCPTRILPASRQRDLGWFMGGVLCGGVIYGAATAYWFYRQKKNQTALLLERNSNGKEESSYKIHDGGVVA